MRSADTRDGENPGQLPGDTRSERYSPGAKERGLRCFLRTAGRPAPALEGMKRRLTPIPSLPVLSQAPVETVVPNGSPSLKTGRGKGPVHSPGNAQEP